MPAEKRRSGIGRVLKHFLRGAVKSIPFVGSWIDETIFGTLDERAAASEAAEQTSKLDAIHSTLEDRSTGVTAAPARAAFNVPPIHPFFTGREDVLARLREALTAGGAAALSQVHAISGLGGIGKTQTAIEYAYRHRDEYDAVFWVRATSETDITTGFIEIAHLLDLPLKNAKEVQETVDAVKRWLEANTGWLLVFDNADEPRVVKPFLPREVNGHILVTSRASVFDMLNIPKPVRLDQMEPDEARDFLFKRTAREPEKADPEEIEAANDIAKELGYLPLALEQAGAFITDTVSSFQNYLTSYRNRRLQLLEERGPVTGDYHESVVTTWTMNFEQVQKASEASADLLRFSAFLHPHRIPLELVKDGAPELGDALAEALENVADDPVSLDRVLEPLTRYSLIRRNKEDDTYDIHRLVQEVIKDGMDESGQRLWAERTVRALNRAFPSVEFENWPLCERILPHARAAATVIISWDVKLEAGGRLLNQAAAYLRHRAQYAEAERLNKRALEIAENLFSPDHPQVPTRLNNLAMLYMDQGKHAQAEPLLHRALEIVKRAPAPDHAHLADALNNLAGLHYAKGRYAEAEPLYERALGIRESALPPGHPDVATSLNNLAALYHAQGNFREAQPLYERALEIREKALGPDHPDIAPSLNNLAALYHNERKYAEAEQLFKRAILIAEMTLGPDHPHVATTLNNLAEVYCSQSRYGDAKPLLERALKIYEARLGPDHPDVANVLNSLARMCHGRGAYVEAEPLLRRALGICETALGPDHPAVAQSLNNLAEVYRAQTRYPEAEPLYKRALEIWEKAPDPEHPDAGTCLGNYALLLRELGRDDEAAEMEARAESIRAKRGEAEKE